MTIERYSRWKDADGTEFRPVSLVGLDLLNDRILNKGTAFNVEERDEFHLRGLIPPRVQTFEEQLNRVYRGYQDIETDLQKYLFLRSLQDRNETLFYRLLSEHIEEMTPIIYTPTVGKACQEFSNHYQQARGLYITPANIDYMDDMVHHFPSKNIMIIVVTDSQGILGIGDQGVGGLGIPIGKLSLYTLGAGIHPACCLPIVLDIGTDNRDLLDDPMYLGIPRKRIRGDEYNAFIEKFVTQIQRHFPNALLQWEDFSKSNAFNNLKRYRTTVPSFNDDIQGTGAVVLAGVLNAMRIKKERLIDQTFIIHGAGAGGVGVANQLHAGLVKEGLSPEEAYARIYILDSRGLLLDNRADLEDYKKPFAKAAHIVESWPLATPGQASLAEVIDHIPVTVLIGTSGVKNAFTEQLVLGMLCYTDRPVIFPLSNPTSNSEAMPENLYRWSAGTAIVATGSPFDKVHYEQKRYRIGQGNNVFIFPGVGLAAIVTRSQVVTTDMFTSAAYALAEFISDEDLAAGTVFPRIKDLRRVSLHVAIRVIEDIIKDQPDHRLAGRDLTAYLENWMWKPEYLPYRRV